MSSEEYLKNWRSKDAEITMLIKNLNHLVDKCLHNMGAEEYEEIQERMKFLLKQEMFWLKNENPKRFVYDLRSFTLWLCDFIADKEREFWGEEDVF